MNPNATTAVGKSKRERHGMQEKDDATPLHMLQAMAEDKSASAFFRAVAHGCVQEVKTLLEGGATADELNEQRETPLYYAALRDNSEIAPVNGFDSDDRTPLFRAVQGGHAHVVTWLVEQGTPVNREECATESTALFRAAEEENLEMVKLLVSLGAKIEFEQREVDRDSQLRSAADDEEVEWEDVEGDEAGEHVGDDEQEKAGESDADGDCEKYGEERDGDMAEVGDGDEVSVEWEDVDEDGEEEYGDEDGE